MKNYLAAFGHVALDQIIALRHLPRSNTSIEVVGRERHFGGTAGNLARAAARLGVRSGLASFVGDDFPSDYRDALRKDGVDLRDLRAVRGARTPTVWIFSDRRGNQMAVIDQGPMKDAATFPVPEHSVRDTDVVHLGTGRPAYYARVADLAADLDRVVGFDPAQELHYVYTSALFRRLLRRSTYFFGNEAELVQAKRFVRATSTQELLKIVPVVIATRGARGSVVYTRERRIHIPRVRPARVVDVTGAGDSYRAGFYAGLSRGFDLRRCALLGATVASFAVEGKGPQTRLPTWPQALRRAQNYAPF